jgi:hypothetical protein
MAYHYIIAFALFHKGKYLESLFLFLIGFGIMCLDMTVYIIAYLFLQNFIDNSWILVLAAAILTEYIFYRYQKTRESKS